MGVMCLYPRGQGVEGAGPLVGLVEDLILKSVHSVEDVLHLLAFLLLGFVGCVAQGDEDGGLFGLRQVEEFLAFYGVEVADPAGGQSLFRGSQAEMLHCYGDVDVAVVLAVCPSPIPRRAVRRR